MILYNIKGDAVNISDNESELDIQFNLVNQLNKLGVKCSQNCSVYIDKIKEENKLEYWKEEKIRKATRKYMYLDILAIKKDKILIIEMKKHTTHTKKQRGYIGAQIDKYNELGIPVKLCKGRTNFKEILNYFA